MCARVRDDEHERRLEEELKAVASTQMAADTLAAVLDCSPSPLDWEIGEALAECLLQDEFGARWPWNENRDRKTPKASLPGADIVGFIGDGDATRLLLGEVKTSSDHLTPPGVMAGRSGLKHQVDELATERGIHKALLSWLSARCRNTAHWPSFMAASRRYLASGGTDFAVVGILLRDTTPEELDLKARGISLSTGTPLPEVRLDAWYVPRPIKQWLPALKAT